MVESLLVLCIILIFVLSWMNVGSLTIPTAEQVLSGSNSTQTIIQTSSNSYTLWELDLPLKYLAQIFPDLLQVDTFWVYYAVIFCIGVFILSFQIARKESASTKLSLSILSTLTLLMLFGADLILFSAIAWFPLVLAALRSGLRAGDLSALLLVINFILGFCLVESGHQLSLIVAISTFFLAYISLNLEDRGRDTSTLLPVLFFIALMAAPTYFCLFSVEIPEFPNYPAHARVVPDDGVPGFYRPLVAIGAPLPILNREYLRATFGALAIVTALISVILLLIMQIKRSTKGVRLMAASFLLTSFVLVDTLPSESFALVGPISTAERLFPGLSYVALTPLLTALAITSLFVAMFQSGLFLYAAVVVFLLASIPYPFASMNHLPFKFGMLLDSSQVAESFAKYPELLVSPSNSLLSDLDINSTNLILDTWRNSSEARPPLVSVSEVGATVTTSAGDKGVRRMFDNSLKTRWSPKAGKQNGTEWIQIALPEAMKISAIDLSPGAHFSDFPRGLSLVFAKDCTTLQNSENILRTISIKNWHGPVQLTEKGFPYYGKESDVHVTLAPIVTGQCILIKQTSTATFDWSVGELKISAEKILVEPDTIIESELLPSELESAMPAKAS